MKKKNVLVVATHPDDETLGAGGFILKHKKLGNRVFVINMTHMREEFGYEKSQILIRNDEIKMMADAYSLDDYINLNLKPAALDTYHESDLIQKISGIFNKIEPDIIVLPYSDDVHSDHRITFNLCYSCTKIFRHPSIKKILMMEVVSETEYALCGKVFQPNFFVDISDYINNKIEIFNYFRSEVGNHPFPRNDKMIRANALIRGSMAGVEYAEAFVLVKYIE